MDSSPGHRRNLWFEKCHSSRSVTERAESDRDSEHVFRVSFAWWQEKLPSC